MIKKSKHFSHIIPIVYIFIFRVLTYLVQKEKKFLYFVIKSTKPNHGIPFFILYYYIMLFFFCDSISDNNTDNCLSHNYYSCFKSTKQNNHSYLEFLYDYSNLYQFAYYHNQLYFIHIYKVQT